MISHIENHRDTVHSENKANRALGGLTLKVNLSTYLFSCRENLTIRMNSHGRPVPLTHGI